MRAELTIAALTMAIQRQKPLPGLIHHSAPPNRQSAKPLNPMSTKSGEGHSDVHAD
jgi:hypothetical protein